MDLKEIGINTKTWVDSAKDRDYWRAFVNAALNLRIPIAMEIVITLYCILLKGWSLLPNALRPFQGLLCLNLEASTLPRDHRSRHHHTSVARHNMTDL